MSKIYIVIKEYDDTLAKRQPWYSIKALKQDLEKKNCIVKIISDLNQVDLDFHGIVIKVFGLKDIFQNHINKKYKLIYLMTFPMYSITKFFTFTFKTTTENWQNLKRIFFVSLLPNIVLKRVLQKADDVIVISDRSEKYLLKIIDVKKYIPFIFDNWDGVKKETSQTKQLKTIGYFGPPFTTRSFDDVINFFNWLKINDEKYNKKIITRIERDELKDIEKKYLSQVADDKSLKVVSGFLDRESLANDLLEIDVLILPFKIVMSELPIVVLEALELGIPIITTEDCGIQEITKDQKNILVLRDFKKDKFKQALNFIENVSDDDFDNVKDIINNINQNTLETICQK